MVNVRNTVIVVLVLVTVVHFNFVPRYKAESRDLLLNGDFRQGLTGWQQQSEGESRFEIIEGGGVILESRHPSRTVFLRQKFPIPKEPILMKLTGVVQTENILKGEAPWHKARLSLVARNEKGKSLWEYPHQIKVPLSTEGWQTYSKVFRVPSEAVEVVVGIEIIRATGTMRVLHMSLFSTKEHPWFSIATNILLVLWGLALIWVGIYLFRIFKSPPVKASLAMACGLILFGVWMPGLMKKQVLVKVQMIYADWIVFLSNAFPDAISQFKIQSYPPIPPDKFGHFILFAFLAYICRLGKPNGSVQALMMNLILFAATTEVLQFFIFNRSPKITDWMIDVSGLLCGIAFSMLFQKIRQN